MEKEQTKKHSALGFEHHTKSGDFYNNAKFRKSAKAIFITNITIFAFLCTIIFIIIFLPLVVWLYSKNSSVDYNTFMEYLTTCVLVGGPVILVTALYGGLAF